MAKLNVTPAQAKAMLAAKDKLADALDIFRPAEHQEDFFRTMEKTTVLEMLLGGAVRAGKSIAAAVCMASMILDKPITFKDGSKHFMRPAHWKGQSLKIWLVGANWNHLGKTMFRLLFAPDLFRVIRDEQTGNWRAWNPANPGETYEKTSPSPALFKMSDVEGGEPGLSWENKKERQFSSCTFKHDGTRIECFASTGLSCPKGDPVHVVWIDEAIDDGTWYNELLSRLIDYRGRLIWTAWPDTSPSDEMTALSDRSNEQHGKPTQKSYAIWLDGSNNPFTQSDHREAIFDTMDEDSRMARDKGILNSDRWRIYPRFNKFVHRAFGPDPTTDDDLARALRQGVPARWTRYMILDPGTAHPAILWVAVPPPQYGDFIVPYDELYVPYTSAEPLARMAAAKMGITNKSAGDLIECFIGDFKAGKQTPMGFNLTILENYAKHFKEVGITSRRHGCHFTPGSDQPATRIMLVQGTLNQRPDGRTRLRIMIGACPNLVKQMEKARWKKDASGNPMDVPAERQLIDVSTCLEYFVSRPDCMYIEPPVERVDNPNSRDFFMKQIKVQLGLQSPRKEKSRVIYMGAGAAENN